MVRSGGAWLRASSFVYVAAGMAGGCWPHLTYSGARSQQAR